MPRCSAVSSASARIASLLWLGACTGPGADDSATTHGGDTGVGLELIDPADLPTGDHPCREPELGTVDYVVDGDTAYIVTSQGREDVRFIGIDTPEVGWDGEPSDCYGDEAQAFSRQVLTGRQVWLTFDATCVDYYGRTLAYVITGPSDQDFFQRRLLREGYATAFPFDATDTFEDVFAEDESWARSQELGLWSVCRR